MKKLQKKRKKINPRYCRYCRDRIIGRGLGRMKVCKRDQCQKKYRKLRRRQVKASVRKHRQKKKSGSRIRLKLIAKGLVIK